MINQGDESNLFVYLFFSFFFSFFGYSQRAIAASVKLSDLFLFQVRSIWMVSICSREGHKRR